MKCSTGLHEMSGDNIEYYERKRKGGGYYTAERCVTCKVARRKMDPSYEWLIEDRVKTLQRSFSPFRTNRRWDRRAGCIGEDPAEMFPRANFNGRRVRDISDRNCSWCPVRTECLVDALATGMSGIRGGMLLPGALLSWDETPLLQQLLEENG